MVCIGYGPGIASLILAWKNGGELNPLIYVFSWNLLVTLFDAALVIRYSRPSMPRSPVSPAFASPAGELIKPVRNQRSRRLPT